jgi:hypothetical protein
MMAFWNPSKELVALGGQGSVASTQVERNIIIIPKSFISELKKVTASLLSLDEVQVSEFLPEEGQVSELLPEEGVIINYNNGDGDVTLDLNQLTTKVTNSISNYFKSNTKEKIDTFNTYYEASLQALGLKALVDAMKNFDQNINTWNQPLVLFFLMGEEIIGNFITQKKHGNLISIILCSILLISLVIKNLW